MVLSMYLDNRSAFGLVFITSLAIGSFLNVVAYRLPIMLAEEDSRGKAMNLAWPPSFCTQCKSNIQWFDNIPLLSFLWLRGRCRSCNQEISRQYFLTELFTLVLSVIVFWRFGVSWAMLAALLFTWYLIPLALIDAKHFILPDQLTISLLWLGLLVNYSTCFVSLKEAVLGAVTGYIALWLVNKFYYLWRKQDGLGQGDWKLLAAFGAWFGVQSLLYILTAAALLGTIFGSILILQKKASKNTPLPFGCFLAMAAWGYLLLQVN